MEHEENNDDKMEHEENNDDKNVIDNLLMQKKYTDKYHEGLLGLLFHIRELSRIALLEYDEPYIIRVIRYCCYILCWLVWYICDIFGHGFILIEHNSIIKVIRDSTTKC